MARSGKAAMEAVYKYKWDGDEPVRLQVLVWSLGIAIGIYLYSTAESIWYVLLTLPVIVAIYCLVMSVRWLARQRWLHITVSVVTALLVFAGSIQAMWLIVVCATSAISMGGGALAEWVSYNKREEKLRHLKWLMGYMILTLLCLVLNP